MYSMIEWSSDLDLTEFYNTAEHKGFTNNSSQKMLVDSLSNEPEYNVWMLKYNDKFVGSVAAHSFNVMGENCYRICARTCVFSDMLPIQNMRTRNEIITHQHITGQFFIPTCLSWAKGRVFITTNENDAGTQRLVHRIFAPSMVYSGQMARVGEIYYRGTDQTVWELFPDKFYEVLNKYPRWV